MPRSSRTKSRKHSNREVRDFSDSEEDLKKNEVSVRVSKDLVAGEKRKVSVKDLLSHGNGDVVDEVVVVSKRRKEKVDGGGSDRWNAGDENDVFAEVKTENLSSRTKEKEKEREREKEKERVSVEFSRSKSGRRHESEKKEEVVEEESKSGRVESRRKGEKEHGRKEYKEKEKEKEKERLDKEKVVVDDGELGRKHSVDVNEERHGKRGRENIGKLRRVLVCATLYNFDIRNIVCIVFISQVLAFISFNLPILFFCIGELLLAVRLSGYLYLSLLHVLDIYVCVDC